MVGWSKVLERYVELGRRQRKRCNSYPKGQQAKGKGHPERFVSGLRCHAGWFYSFWIWWCIIIIINLLGHGVEAVGQSPGQEQCHGDFREEVKSLEQAIVDAEAHLRDIEKETDEDKDDVMENQKGPFCNALWLLAEAHLSERGVVSSPADVPDDITNQLGQLEARLDQLVTALGPDYNPVSLF